MKEVTQNKEGTLSDLNSYKRAKKISKDLHYVLDLLTEIKKELGPFYKYVPVKDIFATVLDSEAILKIHYEKHKKIVETKGSILPNEVEKTKN